MVRVWYQAIIVQHMKPDSDGQRGSKLDEGRRGKKKYYMGKIRSGLNNHSRTIKKDTYLKYNKVLSQ